MRYYLPLALSVAILLLAGCGAPEEDDIAPAETANTTPTPTLSEYVQHYNELLNQCIAMEMDYHSLNTTYAKTARDLGECAQKREEYKKQANRLQADYSQLATVWGQKMQSETELLRKYDSLVATNEAVEGLLMQERERYKSLVSRINEVTNQTDNITTANLTTGEQAIYYKGFMSWVGTLELE